MGMKNERARRLEDIARRCGVSISSVSRVLNNEPGVSADTRRRVLAAAGQQEFRPRPRKRHLSRALLDLLVVIPEEEELSANPFLNISELAGAIGEAFRDEKKRIEVAPIGDFSRFDREGRRRRTECCSRTGAWMTWHETAGGTEDTIRIRQPRDSGRELCFMQLLQEHARSYPHDDDSGHKVRISATREIRTMRTASGLSNGGRGGRP